MKMQFSEAISPECVVGNLIIDALIHIRISRQTCLS